ncbi:hypothetical protein ACKWTF_005441 [Chironomus riparius]
MKKVQIYKYFEALLKLLLQLFGYFPISSFETDTYKNLVEIFLKVWSSVIISGILFYISYAVCNEKDIFSNFIIGKANDILKFVTVYAAFSINVIETNLRWRRLRKLEMLCKGFERIVNFNKFQFQMRKTYIFKFITMAVLVCIVEVQIVSTVTTNKWKCYWLLIVIPIVACRLRTMQYIYYLNLIRFYTKMINQEMKMIALYSSKCFKKAETDFISKRLQILKHFYQQLYKITEATNTFFCFSINFNFIHEFIESGTEYYYIYLSLTDSTDVNLCTAYISAFGPTVFMFLPLYEAELIECEASKIGDLLHSIKKNEVDTELYQIIHYFSLQIHQEKIELHSSSIANINLKLFVSIVGGLMTYLILFIQFSTLAEEQKDKSNVRKFTITASSLNLNFIV